jgi:hypothetical protein
MLSKTSNTEMNNNEMLLPYRDLLIFLFIITINQSMLHLHLLDEKNALFIQKSPKNIIHFIALLAIVAYLIFTYKRLAQKDNMPLKHKFALIGITAILITSNVLLFVKSLSSRSLPYLPLVMIGCFLTALIIFRAQHYFKKQELNGHRYDEKILAELHRASNIESIQLLIGLLGFSAVSFELIYDKALTKTIKLFKLEAPQLAHHCCILLQIFTALFIIGCLIAKKNSPKTNHYNNVEKETSLYSESFSSFNLDDESLMMNHRNNSNDNYDSSYTEIHGNI